MNLRKARRLARRAVPKVKGNFKSRRRRSLAMRAENALRDVAMGKHPGRLMHVAQFMVARLLRSRTPEDRKTFAAQLKRRATASEKRVEKYLRALKISYRFQKRRGPFVADFWLRKFAVVLEVDGSSHKGREEYDRWRDCYCKLQGWQVIRVPNEATYSVEEFLKFIPDEVKSGVRG